MNKLSFDIKNSNDFFLKLKEDYSDLEKDLTSSRIALNCAMTAWHLSEWIYHEFDFKDKFKKIGDFQESLKEQCESLQIIHDISNGSKHYRLTKHEPKIQETDNHIGTFDYTFDFSFDTSRLEIKMQDGRTLFFENEIKNVIAFWDDFLKKLKQ